MSGVGNGVWLTDFARRAVDAGSCMRFFATHGNASFSDSHRYAVVHYLNRLRPWRSLWLCAPAMRGDVPYARRPGCGLWSRFAAEARTRRRRFTDGAGSDLLGRGRSRRSMLAAPTT